MDEIVEAMPQPESGGADARAGNAQDALFRAASTAFSASLYRLSRAFEAEPSRREDLLQEIHLSLWRSFASFDGRCSLRTWVFRVAHNVAIKHIVANRRIRLRELQSLDDSPEPESLRDGPLIAERDQQVARLHTLIERLKPLDRQIILLYLEELSAAQIAEVVGLSSENCATKIHRIKKILSSLFAAGGGS
jgi:RNA polymerase sigma-70 factor (ECF subfamily)